MAEYPGAIDSAASLFTPVDAFSGKPLETTTIGAVQAGDSTINVASTSGGFAASYGVLSIDDELIVYTGKTATSFTGCQRGAFGTAASGHNNGVAVKANMVAGFITALQSAVVAIENELGTAAARNYIRKDDAVTVTGFKTFQDGAEFGSGTKSSTGLVRLPNGGAVKWKKQDNSGDLGIALNASNHLAMDAIIFAAGQTFGASTVQDATTLAKGIVQIDPVGGNRCQRWRHLPLGIRHRAWHLYEAHDGLLWTGHGGRATLCWRPARPHARGRRHRLRRAPVHDPEQRRGGLSIPYGALPAFGNQYGPRLSGKIVMETGNPYPERDGDAATQVLASGLGTGHWSARWLPGARLVRAFNSVWDRTLAREAHRPPPRVGVPLAADDAGAMETVAGLVRNTGFDPVLVGPLSRARDFDVGTDVYNTNMSGPEVRQALGLPQAGRAS